MMEHSEHNQPDVEEGLFSKNFQCLQKIDTFL